MIANRGFFSRPPIPAQKITGTSGKDSSNSRKMATMISLSALILAFFLVARTVTSTDDV